MTTSFASWKPLEPLSLKHTDDRAQYPPPIVICSPIGFAVPKRSVATVCPITTTLRASFTSEFVKYVPFDTGLFVASK